MLIMKKYDNLLNQKLYTSFEQGNEAIGSSLFSLEFSNRNYVLVKKLGRVMHWIVAGENLLGVRHQNCRNVFSTLN